jgi:hypothetical protein
MAIAAGFTIFALQNLPVAAAILSGEPMQMAGV